MPFAIPTIFLGVIRDLKLGTKGSTNIETLGYAKSVSKQASEVELELPFSHSHDKNQINQNYANWLDSIKEVEKEKPMKRISETKTSDLGNSFRTHLLLFWIFTNASLIVVITNNDMIKLMSTTGLNSYYLTFILWSNVFFSSFKSLGSIIYRIKRIYG
jgi:chitin synthase